MSDLPLAKAELFPNRKSTTKRQWTPVYLEPRPGSGERVCIGVLSGDDDSVRVLPVADLGKLECAYGPLARSFAWAAELALIEVEDRALQMGFSQAMAARINIEGLHFGEPRIGAGESVRDLMELALQQVSALYAPRTHLSLAQVVGVADIEAGARGEKFIAQVRKQVTSTRPEQRPRFGVTFRASQSSRVIRFGYVGKNIAANFASLNSQRVQSVTGQVDRAKARLWDLHQLGSGVLADAPLGLPQSIRYELLVHRPHGGTSIRGGDLPPEVRRAIGEAEEELEAEADKFHIHFRPMRSADQIAQHIMQAEAA